MEHIHTIICKYRQCPFTAHLSSAPAAMGFEQTHARTAAFLGYNTEFRMESQGTHPNSTGPGAKAHEVAAKMMIDAQHAAEERIFSPLWVALLRWLLEI